MKKEISFSKKITFLFLLTSFLSFQTAYSQCTNPVPIGDVAQSFCKADNETVSSLVITSPGTIVWYDAMTGGNQYSSSAPLFDGTTYFADDISSSDCSTARLAVTVTIDGDFPADVNVFVGFCASQNASIADLSATGTNIEWYDAATAGTLLASSHVLMDGEIYWVQQTENGCVSARFPTVVTIVDPPPPTVDPVQTFCIPPNPTVGDLTGSGVIVWYDTDTSTTPLDPAEILVDGENYWGAQSSIAFPCESTVRTETMVQLDVTPIAGTDGTLTVCEADLVLTNLFDSLVGSPDMNGVWTGPTVLTGGYLGTFTPGTNTEGVYTYTSSSLLGVCPDESANITVTITVVPPPSTTEANQSFCEIDGATVADLVATGNGLVWFDTETSTTPLLGTDLLTDGDYWAAQTDAGTGCISAMRLVVNVTINMPPPPTTTEVNQSFCEIDGATIADLMATGTSITWYDTDTSTTPLATTDALVDGEDYWASDTDATTSCESASRLVINVSIITPPPPTTTEANQSFCEIDGATVADLSATGDGILWYDTDTSTTALDPSEALVDGEDYWASQTDITSSCESASRLMVTATIIVIPPPTTTEANQSFCEIDGATVVDLSATGDGVIWYDTETSTTALATTDALVDGEDYWASQTDITSGCVSATRLVVTATIIVIQPPTTTEANQSFCEIDGATIADLSATGDGILWYDMETSTIALATTDALIDGEDYWATQTDATSGCTSSSRLVVTVTITMPPPPTTTEVNQSFCDIDGATVAELSATGNNILWYDTNTSTTPLDTTEALVDGEDYWASQEDATTGCESATRLVVTVTIIVPTPPTTTETNQSFCEIDGATIADLNVTGTNILWYDTETSTTALDPSEALIDGEDYWASQEDTASGCESLTRLVVTATIIVIPPPTTTEANQSFCEIDGATVADLMATGTSVLWYDTETSTTALATTDALVDGEDYWASQEDAMSGCVSASRLVVTTTIIMPPPPTTTETTQSFCEIDGATVADLSATGDGILWYDTETSTTPLATTDALIDGEDYWATQTETIIGCESATRLMVTATIIVTLPPTTTNVNQSFCDISVATVADLMATGINILWYDTETSTTALDSSEALVDGEDYWATQEDGTLGCESVTRLVVNVSIVMPPPPTTTEVNQAFCEIEGATVADLSATGTNILWYDTETSTTALGPSESLVDGEDYWASQEDTVSGCESLSRLVINVTINMPQPPTTTETTQPFCLNDFLPGAPTIADLAVTGTSVTWYADETSTTPLATTDDLVNGEDYWASDTDATTGCESATRLVVNANIIDLPAPTGATSQVFCLVNAPTIADLNVEGSNIIWYDTDTSTTPLGTTDLLVDGEDYYATQSADVIPCESLLRLLVVVTVTDVAPASITNVSQNFCATDAPTVAALEATGSGIIWYDSETDTTPLATTDALVDGGDYWAVQTDGTTGCESPTRVVANITLTDPGTPILSAQGNEFCIIDEPRLSDLDTNVTASNGGIITWYDAYPNGSILNLSQSLTEGGTYYAAESDGSGCESVTALAVTVTLESCDQYDVVLYDGFSPTGDGVNDTFVVEHLRILYPDFKVEFFNRWGSLVYTSNASKSDWNGELDGKGELAPAGVYYFIVYFNKDNKEPVQDRLYLSR